MHPSTSSPNPPANQANRADERSLDDDRSRSTGPKRAITAKVVIGSCAFALGLVASTFFFATLVPIAVALPYRLRWRIITQWCHFNIRWLSLTCDVRYEIEGLSNLPAEPGVVLARHESAWETLALQRCFAPQAWVLKRELLWIPLFGWGLATLNPIAIDRRNRRRALKKVIEEGTKRLEDGCWVVIYPEGTRMAPQAKKRFGSGGSKLAINAARPVIPVAHNAGDCWPRNSFFKYPGTIRVVIGKAIDTRDRKPEDITSEAQEFIHATMKEIRSRNRRR